MDKRGGGFFRQEVRCRISVVTHEDNNTIRENNFNLIKKGEIEQTFCYNTFVFVYKEKYSSFLWKEDRTWAKTTFILPLI